MKIDRFLTADPLRVIIILPGLFSLWIFIIPYIYQVFTPFGFSTALQLAHFLIQVLILSSNVFVWSLFKYVNELLFIWHWIFSWHCSLFNKTTHVLLSWILTVWSFNTILGKIFIPQLKGYCKFFDNYHW